MKRTWMPVVAGVLNILVGVTGLIAVVVLAVTISFTQGAQYYIGVPYWIPVHTIALLGLIAVYLFITSLLSLIGGIYSVRRKAWALALAGSIASVFTSAVFGIVSVILIALAQEEFGNGHRQISLNSEKAA